MTKVFCDRCKRVMEPWHSATARDPVASFDVLLAITVKPNADGKDYCMQCVKRVLLNGTITRDEPTKPPET